MPSHPDRVRRSYTEHDFKQIADARLECSMHTETDPDCWRCAVAEEQRRRDAQRMVTR